MQIILIFLKRFTFYQNKKKKKKKCSLFTRKKPYTHAYFPPALTTTTLARELKLNEIKKFSSDIDADSQNLVEKKENEKEKKTINDGFCTKQSLYANKLKYILIMVNPLCI